MHELSMCEAIARKVVDLAAGVRVLAVTIRVGHLRQVVPEAMTFSWQMLSVGTALEGSALHIEYVPAVVACGECAAITTLEAPILACGSCGSRGVTLRSGDELLIVSVETAGDPVVAGDQR